jgi:hypothetical protein
MDLHPGDWVKTDSNLKGRVIHVSRLSAFVEIHFEGGVETLPFLLSELTKIDPPDTKQSAPPLPTSPHG